MKESPKSFIGASLLRGVVAGLVAEMHHIHGILLAVIHDLLLITAGSWSLGKFLGLAVIHDLLLITAGSWSLGKFLGLAVIHDLLLITVVIHGILLADDLKKHQHPDDGSNNAHHHERLPSRKNNKHE
jgi:hypothetical protein